jgi:hypothetical protein
MRDALMETQQHDGPVTRSRRGRLAALAIVPAAIALALLNLQVATATGALFTSSDAAGGQASTGRIFPGHRTTPAFTIADSSSGTTVDRSSPIAYPGDGRWSVSHPWGTAFTPDRVLELVLNHPLAAGLDVPSAQLTVTLASDDAGGTACWYVDLVRTSSGTVLSSHGSASSPLACTGGTTFVRTVVPLPGVAGSDAANDLTIRLHGRNSAGAAARIDEVTLSGATSLAPFTLYPVLTRDASDGNVETVPWLLAGE